MRPARPKAKGLPGRIRTRQKSMPPSSFMTSRTTSWSPTETPPELIIRSAERAASSAASTSSRESLATGSVLGTAPAASTWAASIGVLLLRI